MSTTSDAPATHPGEDQGKSETHIVWQKLPRWFQRPKWVELRYQPVNPHVEADWSIRRDGDRVVARVTETTVDHFADLEAIVRDLGAQDPTEPEQGDCVLCPARVVYRAPADGHDPSCPWRRAREWVEAHDG